MSKDTKRPWEQVSDPSYFKKVMGNMFRLGLGPRSGEGRVRFGVTGRGHAPNYQIEGPDGLKHCYRGRGHAEASDVDEEFAPANLSDQQFTYKDVEGMLARLIG